MKVETPSINCRVLVETLAERGSRGVRRRPLLSGEIEPSSDRPAGEGLLRLITLKIEKGLRGTPRRGKSWLVPDAALAVKKLVAGPGQMGEEPDFSGTFLRTEDGYWTIRAAGASEDPEQKKAKYKMATKKTFADQESRP